MTQKLHKWDIITGTVRVRPEWPNGKLRPYGTAMMRHLDGERITVIVGMRVRGGCTEHMLWPTKQSLAPFELAGVSWLPSGDLVEGTIELIGSVTFKQGKRT